MPAATAFDPNRVLDLERYPLAQDGPARRALLAEKRRELEANQFCLLPGFIRPAALAAMVAEARGLRESAYRNISRRNCFLQRRGDPDQPQEHPRNILLEASYRMIAKDLFAEGSLLTGLYDWAPFRQAVAEIVEAAELFANADPYQPVNVLCYGAGDRSTWHFDSTNAFTVTLMLQAPEAGGDFQIAPNSLPEAADPAATARLAAILRDGGEGGEGVLTVPREPGALVIFRGCRSVHRVTEVRGDIDRLMAVLVYETEAGVLGDPEVNRTIYGPRVAAAQ
jgi:hypothetical protein